MKTVLLVIFSLFLTLEFFGSFISWINAKSNREYWWRFVDTLCSAGLIFAFIKLVEVLSV